MRKIGLLLLVLPGLLAAQESEPTVDEATGLKVAPGWLAVRAHCGGCHSHALVTAQRGDRAAWLAMIRWMQETQNLWEFQPEVEEQILGYLATNYAPLPPTRRAPLAADQRPSGKSL